MHFQRKDLYTKWLSSFEKATRAAIATGVWSCLEAETMPFSTIVRSKVSRKISKKSQS
jgi:hypothetical protein